MAINLAAYRTMAQEAPNSPMHAKAVLELCDEIERLRSALAFLAQDQADAEAARYCMCAGNRG